MDLEQLRQLDAIDRAGTMSAAAAELHVTQPTLSRSIQRLEAELGCALFDREGRRVSFNGAGRIALEHARRMLAEERHLKDALADHARRSRAVRIGTVAPAPLWRLTAILVERFPQVVLTSETLSGQDVARGVLDGTLDLGIALKPCPLPTVTSCPVMTEALSVSLPQDHPLAGRSSLDAADLDGEQILLYRGIGVWREFVDRHLAHSDLVIQEDRTTFDAMLPATPLPFFVTNAPSLANEIAGRVRVPLRDPDARKTFYLLIRDGARCEAQDAFAYVRKLDPA